MKYFYIAGTIAFTVYGQLILKWRMSLIGVAPSTISGKALFYLTALTDIYVISGLLAAFLASLFWMAAVSMMSLNQAYPFMGLNFVIVMFLSHAFFKEQLSVYTVVGTMLIVAGIVFLNLKK